MLIEFTQKFTQNNLGMKILAVELYDSISNISAEVTTLFVLNLQFLLSAITMAAQVSKKRKVNIIQKIFINPMSRRIKSSLNQKLDIF